MLHIYRCLLFFFLIACSLSVVAQEKEELTADKKCMALIKKGMQAKADQDYAQALEIYTQAALIAEEENLPDKLWYLKNGIGLIYASLSNYGEALTKYREALEIITASDNEEIAKNTAVVLSNIGLLHNKNGDHVQALEFYKRAYDAAQASQVYSFQKAIGTNIADLYLEEQNIKAARAILKEVKEKCDQERINQTWEITYAESYLIEGKIQKAKTLAEAIFVHTDKNGGNECYGCIVELLADIYTAQGDIEQAIYYAKLQLEANAELDNKIETYQKLSRLYAKKRDYNISLAYKDSVINTKDSLSKLMNARLFEVNKIKFEIQEYQNDLKVSKQAQAGERRLFITIIIAGLILFFFLYRWQKNRIAKQKQAREIIENKQKIINLELDKEKNEHLLLEKQLVALQNKSKLKQERLKNKIAEKNRKLSAKALYLSGRNELIEDVIKSLINIPEVSKNTAVSDQIKRLKEHLKIDEEWDEFIRHFEKVNPGFVKTLKRKHPKLTNKDIRFICYVYMNLNTKEICAIFNITPEACRKRKQRLLKKMKVDKEEITLYEYVISLS
ncbi:tetratricopeptide repeat protein [Mesonia aquimarina]|uniref:tetratricopeptide repeat protein n=1 Tax=Mesonia aquimarina TaxID=1504967 RepID=UPI000EF60C3B|nr:tetratricopeptide repeat protein [Mesonia aquimarina]